MSARLLDLAGLKCPLPVLRTRKALRGMAAGERLEVRCTDPLAAIDIPSMVEQTGELLLSATKDGEALVFVIERTARPDDASVSGAGSD